MGMIINYYITIWMLQAIIVIPFIAWRYFFEFSDWLHNGKRSFLSNWLNKLWSLD